MLVLILLVLKYIYLLVLKYIFIYANLELRCQDIDVKYSEYKSQICFHIDEIKIKANKNSLTFEFFISVHCTMLYFILINFF